MLTAAACIVLDDLTIDDLDEYLPLTVGGQRTGVWDGVLSRLHDQTNDPATDNLRKVLATPLMVFLARTIYSDTPDYGDPVVLLDTKRFPTAVAVKEHLFECFVPATYRRRSNRLRSRSWTVERAQRWLAFLAWELEHRQSAGNGLAWWQIANAAPRTLSAVSVGIVAGLAGALGYPFPIGFGLGFMFALFRFLFCLASKELLGKASKESAAVNGV